jgi:hypothetical protein
VGASPYEVGAWSQIRNWKSAQAGGPPGPGAEGPAGEEEPSGSDRLAGRADRVFSVLTGATGDVAQWRIDLGVLRRLRRAGAPVERLSDIGQLGLEIVDRAVAPLRRRYVGSMTVEGAATGFFGAVGTVVDVPLLVLTNLRAVGEYGTHYGFDLGEERERLFAAQVLALGASATAPARAGALQQLELLAAGGELGVTWSPGRDRAAGAGLRRLARNVAVGMARRRVTRVVPVVGTLSGAAANRRLTGDTCTAAYHLYRERFLIRKHGRPAP